MAGLVSEDEAERLFAPLRGASKILLAVSGGADSTALLFLAMRWAKFARKPLIAVTVDHALRAESADEAAAVARLAQALGVPHEVAVWQGEKPATGVEAAAREARYALLIEAARRHGASHMMTAHTEDDQAETVLMRLAAGSGPAGLAGMRAEVLRDGIVHARPLLGVAKARLMATLEAAGIGWCEDAMNFDARFARPRLRQSRAALEREGLTAQRLARFAQRMARMEDAVEAQAREAFTALIKRGEKGLSCAGDAFLALPQEMRLRVLKRAIEEAGDRSVIRLERLEDLEEEVSAALVSARLLGRTLGGAVVRVTVKAVLTVQQAPARRGKQG